LCRGTLDGSPGTFNLGSGMLNLGPGVLDLGRGMRQLAHGTLDLLLGALQRFRGMLDHLDGVLRMLREPDKPSSKNGPARAGVWRSGPKGRRDRAWGFNPRASPHRPPKSRRDEGTAATRAPDLRPDGIGRDRLSVLGVEYSCGPSGLSASVVLLPLAHPSHLLDDQSHLREWFVRRSWPCLQSISLDWFVRALRGTLNLVSGTLHSRVVMRMIIRSL
jgi:hypothetical protein